MRVQPAVAATVAVVVAVTLVSGPLVGLVDLTGAETFSPEDLGEGRATVGDVTLPDRVVFERGDFGAGSYYLRVPSATVELREVVGRPILSYEVSVDSLGYTRSAINVVSSDDAGEFELVIEDVAFGPEQLDRERYAGELTVDVRYGGRQHVLATKNVTIEVVG